MKKMAVFVLTAVIIMTAAVSCKTKQPTVVDPPTATPTFTITQTSTDTPGLTPTSTFTVTVTSTATPAPLWIDDVEDDNFANLISSWSANTATGTTVHALGPQAAPPGAGSYAMGLTATTQIQAGQTMNYLGLSTGATGSATPVDARLYNHLRFGRMLNGVIASGSGTFFVEMTNDVVTASWQIGGGLSQSYGPCDINLRFNYGIGGGTIEELLADVKQIRFMYYLNGTSGDSAMIELVIDDVRFTHN
jgi:hypothetical protein